MLVGSMLVSTAPWRSWPAYLLLQGSLTQAKRDTAWVEGAVELCQTSSGLRAVFITSPVQDMS